ncbi:MAG TPA: ATP-binding cassette domain-containing protein [Acidimicrobiales bacterium]|nr:ATP-binding cassette domain-containing protein [Acidimicrobiales bacterium]
MITFDHVSKRYGHEALAVEDLSLSCADGEITVIVGPSGCGKTTSLRMINRLVEPTSGVISVDGKDVRASDPALLRRSIGYVIQQGGLFPHRTVMDNIATVPRLLGASRAKARERAAALLALVGLPEQMAARYPHQLSGGQQQRVGVARALAGDPPVLLMDEAFSALDPVVRADLQKDLLQLQSQVRKTIVFVTHDIDEAVKIGDRIAVMQTGGKLSQFGTPEQVLAHPANGFVANFLGFDRGIRWLSLFPAKSLVLRDPPTVGPAGGPADVKAASSAAGTNWVLMLDPKRRPVGWVDASTLDGDGDGALDPAQVRPIGHTFAPATESLRAALDAMVLSPSGLAVAADNDGSLLGAVSEDDIDSAIRDLAGRS